ncbi:Neutral ceramidase [Acorus calamus]|uniref:ceramidase n=1 Tax=Acorus calamus TaxID=4465 RepID=A0AAV9D6I8_ACOCL|nr:Neutral ceramidase [Acorus calamus]
MAGRRLREAVKETLIANGKGEFDDDTHVVIAGLSNTYSQYITTFEEYQQQRYEVTITNSLTSRGWFRRGEKASATFWSAAPRNDLLTEGTFASVEMLMEDRWMPVYDDDDLRLFFKWTAIEWEIPEKAVTGV